MKTLGGSCLCGDVRFEVQGPLRGIGQCCCSLCRKASGVSGSMVFLVPGERFRWLQGEEHVKTWKLRATYSSVRCERCGSPAPASFDGKHYWVPPGLMDDDLETRVLLHHHVASKADWVELPDHVPHFDAYPPNDVVFGDE